MRVQQRRQQRHLARRCTTGVGECRTQRGTQRARTAFGRFLAGWRIPRLGEAVGDATEGWEFVRQKQRDRIDGTRRDRFGQCFGRGRRLPEHDQRNMLRRWLLHDLYGVSIDNDTKSLEGACGVAQSGVRRGNNHQRWRVGRIEHRAQCIRAASGGGNRVARRHRQWGIDNRILRDTARATEIRLEKRLGFRGLFFKCDDTLQFVGCAGEQCLQ